jgi:RNA polymerase sigma-70 factor, ECF subfamily
MPLEIPLYQVNAARAGDAEATAELLRLAWPNAYRIAWSILQERGAAEDAAQDACARVLSALDGLRSSERFAPWFYWIVVNESRRRLRSNAREVSLESGLRRENEISADSEATRAGHIDLRRALASLEPDLRLAIVMRYYFGLSSTEIARIVNASPVTVRWRLMIARRRLRTLLEEPRSLSHLQAEAEGA